MEMQFDIYLHIHIPSYQAVQQVFQDLKKVNEIIQLIIKIRKDIIYTQYKQGYAKQTFSMFGTYSDLQNYLGKNFEIEMQPQYRKYQLTQYGIIDLLVFSFLHKSRIFHRVIKKGIPPQISCLYSWYQDFMGKFEITYNIEPNYLPKKEKRVQIQKNNEQKSNPELIESIQDDKFIVFKDLIEKGASIYKILKEERQNVSSSFGIQKYARINYAEYLQNKNVDWECEDNDGMTPLFQAIKRESIKMIEYLLKQKVNLEHQDNQNRTPFYYACSFGQLFIIGFLLERGANINLEQLWEELHFQKQVFQDYIMWLNIYFNNLIQTIIMQINQEEMHYIMQYLILKVVEMEDKLGLPLIAQLLLEHRIDVESKDKDENTPLYEPASSEALSSIPILIAFGCDINSRNKFGETALIVAAKFNHYETAKLLIENQADFLLENEGFTAMEIAVKMINLKHFNIYQIK